MMHGQSIPQELIELTEELDALGGGDTRIGEATVYCRIRPAQPGEETVAAADGGHVLVRDHRSAPDAPAQQSVRRFRVSAALDPETAASQEALFEVLGSEALRWVLDGFNATVIAHGETGSGKTYTLFGPNGVTGRSFEQQALCGRTLERLYGAIGPSSPLSLAVSCWEVRHSGVIDLLAPDDAPASAAGGTAATAADFATVRAPSLQEAVQLLALAQSRSVNWSASGAAAQPSALPNRASLFVRLSLYDADRRSLSSLVLVDLVGTAPLGSTAAGAASADYERRCLNQHLLCFNRVVSELSQQQAVAPSAPNGGGGGGGAKLLSARDSKLTQTLAPLLAGSSRTFLLACVRPQPQHHLETTNTLRIATRALSIRTACMRMLHVAPDRLGRLEPAAVLPAPEAKQSAKGGAKGAANPRPLSAALDAAAAVLTGRNGSSGSAASTAAAAAAANGAPPPPSAAAPVPAPAPALSRPYGVGWTETATTAPDDESPAALWAALQERQRQLSECQGGSCDAASSGAAAAAASAAAVPTGGDAPSADELREEIHSMISALGGATWGGEPTAFGTPLATCQPAVEEWVRAELSRRVHSQYGGKYPGGSSPPDAASASASSSASAGASALSAVMAASCSPPERGSYAAAHRQAMGSQGKPPLPSVAAASACSGGEGISVSSGYVAPRGFGATTTSNGGGAAAPPPPRWDDDDDDDAFSLAPPLPGTRRADLASGGGGVPDATQAPLASPPLHVGSVGGGGGGCGAGAEGAGAPLRRDLGGGGATGGGATAASAGGAGGGGGGGGGGGEGGGEGGGAMAAAAAAGGDYEALLRLLKRSEDAKGREQRRADELEQSCAEATTSLELELHSQKMESLELRKKLRRIQQDGAFADLFGLYEDEIAALHADAAQRRREHVELEAACRDALLQREADRAARDAAAAEGVAVPPGSPDGVGGSGSADIDAKLARVRSWRTALARCERESAALKAELLENQKKLRQSELHRKAAEEAGRKLRALSREHERTTLALQSLQLSHSQLGSQKAQLEADTEGLSRAHATLQGRLAEVSAEAAQLSESKAQLQYERRKEALLVKMPRLASLDSAATMGLPSAASRGRLKDRAGSASDLLGAMERELGSSGARHPKLGVLLHKAMRQVRDTEEKQHEAAAREEELLQMIVQQMTPEQRLEATGSAARLGGAPSAGRLSGRG